MENLYRLPDGTHLQLSEVNAIKPQPSYSFENIHQPAVLHIIAGPRNGAYLTFESYEQAVEYGDKLAALVNEARRAKQIADDPMFAEVEPKAPKGWDFAG